ncbi:MAG: drug/metabolite transporter (DMT)-like permease [Polaribacter sp.]|jgi:drug/metabolite transporter (DMT)-like permease
MTNAHKLTPESSPPRRLFGIATVLISAASFGLMPVFASLSYDGGGNAITFTVVRTIAILLLITPLVFLLKRGWRIPQKSVVPVALTIVSNLGLGVGILSAVQYIPVALALLILYIYPALVIVIETLTNRQKLSPLHIIVCLLAFLGLALVLAPSIGELDWRGIAFAFMACISITILMLSTHRARRDVDEITLIFWSNSGGLPLMFLILPLFGGLALPETEVSWMALAIGSFCYIVGFWGYALSMRFISASQASLIYNVEPIVAIIAAAAILGEYLDWVQVCGAVLVIVAVFLATRFSN